MEDNIKYVTCKICGAKRRILTQHLRNKHGLSRWEYEEEYKSPAVCYERQLIQIERNKDLNNMLSTDPYYVDLMAKVRHSNGTLPHVIEALNNGRKEYQESDEGKLRNSEIMKNNHRFRDIQSKATAGKLNSEKFHRQKSEFMTNLLNEKWSDSEWRSSHLKKMFDGSKKEYIDYNGNVVKFRSSWELYLHNYLTFNDVKYDYETIRIRYVSSDNIEHEYIPDFYIPDMNHILEVKPHMYVSNKINQIKRQVALYSGYSFKFVTENELRDIDSFFHNL